MSELSPAERSGDRPPGDSVLALGTFDGLHLIRQVVAHARDGGMRSVVVTFEPHPLEVLRPGTDPVLLTTLEERIALLSDLGVDVALVLRFDLEFSQTPAHVWLDDVLAGRLRARVIFAGSSYTFGYRREGTAQRLAEWGRSRGIDVHLVPAVLVDGEPVSSSRIRSALREGLVDEAARLLGRYYSLHGRVAAGAGRGRTIGFPTANLAVDSPRKILPGGGVYATIATVGGRRYRGATNVGRRPTFGGGQMTVETHLLEFDVRGSVVGEPFSVEFVRRIREERAFSGPEALGQQIARDVAQVRELLVTVGPGIIR
ncbi:MAG: riboflavin biosynthesis protein RibF [Armatimonadetes bacterium 13_1_40CM_3_65_7]|nr:MAG: riboflavin biosynthesis protein RibF [Armatimonadetes bacterium 13_1_40CM_3_65_7]